MSVVIDDVRVAAYTVPNDSPESDGTLAWDSTTCVMVEVSAGGMVGLGYTYSHVATAQLIASKLAGLLRGESAFRTASFYQRMRSALRNLGEVGIAAMAVSAVDIALWDLKAKMLGTSLVRLLGIARDAVPIYGSGGFTSYSVERLCDQLSGWVSEGIARVKMKVGQHPKDDVARVEAARKAIGPRAELFVDANGAYDRKQALSFAYRFAELGVNWFEEPVSKNDHEGFRLLRDRCPPGMEITVGEYVWSANEFRDFLSAGLIDVPQADITRCGGVTGFMNAAMQCEAALLPLSSHCAPALSLHVGAAAPALRHVEYFYDHVRIERMFFDGVPGPILGCLRPDPERMGHGLEFKHADAERFLVWRN